MTEHDREKVIKGLECCANGCVYGCPYADEPAHCTDYLAKDSLELLKAQEPCMDAVSREAVLDLAQTYGPATYDMPYGSGDMIIRPEDVKILPSIQPISLARLMTLEDIWNLGDSDPLYLEYRLLSKTKLEPAIFQPNDSDNGGGDGYMCVVSAWCSSGFYNAKEYGKTWRCWTSRPTDEQRKAVKWG